jgi:hypothetical protein
LFIFFVRPKKTNQKKARFLKGGSRAIVTHTVFHALFPSGTQFQATDHYHLTKRQPSNPNFIQKKVMLSPQSTFYAIALRQEGTSNANSLSKLFGGS